MSSHRIEWISAQRHAKFIVSIFPICSADVARRLRGYMCVVNYYPPISDHVINRPLPYESYTELSVSVTFTH